MADITPIDDEINLLDLLQVIADNLRLLIVGPLLAGLVALGYSFTITPVFTARTQILPPQQEQSAALGMLASLGSIGSLAGAATGLTNPADQHVAFLRSNTVQSALVERFKLRERYAATTRGDAREALDKKVQITSGKDGLISVEVDDRDPQFAADLANAHVEELGKLMSQLAVTEAQKRRLFFEKQLAQTKDKLTQADIALKAAGIPSSILKSNPATAMTGLATLQAQVTAQEVKLRAMRGYLAESAPDFKQAMNELTALQAQLSKQERSEPAGTGGKGNGDYVARYRDYKYHETLFELFTRQYEVARLDEAREGAVIQVVDQATAPERKSKPKKAVIAMTTAMACGIALLLFVFGRQTLVSASRNAQDAVRLQQLRVSLRRALSLRPSKN